MRLWRGEKYMGVFWKFKHYCWPKWLHWQALLTLAWKAACSDQIHTSTRLRKFIWDPGMQVVLPGTLPLWPLCIQGLPLASDKHLRQYWISHPCFTPLLGDPSEILSAKYHATRGFWTQLVSFLATSLRCRDALYSCHGLASIRVRQWMPGTRSHAAVSMQSTTHQCTNWNVYCSSHSRTLLFDVYFQTHPKAKVRCDPFLIQVTILFVSAKDNLYLWSIVANLGHACKSALPFGVYEVNHWRQ